MTDNDLIKALVDKGLTYESVGNMFGISRQRVHQIHSECVSNRKSLGKIIYPNLLKWSIEHKVNRSEFLYKMGLTANQKAKAKLARVLKGTQSPNKDYIDMMLQATGLSYETLFEVFPDGD